MKELEVECGNGTSGSIFHQRFSGELWLLIRFHHSLCHALA